MKNQYFGDVNDYRKYGLLRGFAAATPIHVAWMLTPDDGRTDGKFTRYLQDAGRWRYYDPELFDALHDEMAVKSRRCVAAVPERGLLPGAAYFADMVPDAADPRATWAANLHASYGPADLVFFDPDNGLEIPSKPMGRRDSSKYVYWSELLQTWQRGSSLLVYQHFCRENREAFLTRLASAFRARLCQSSVAVFRTSNVAFFLVQQPDHVREFTQIARSTSIKWRGQLMFQEL